MSQRPIAIGLLLCEQLIIQEGTKNVTPVNCFNRRMVEPFPWVSPPFLLLTWLTNGEGQIFVEVMIEDAKTLEELYHQRATVRMTDPLQQVRLSVRIDSVTFSKPGTYRVLLLADGEVVAQRKLAILRKETSNE